MIEEYFNLTKAPFRLSADTDFYFDSARHRKALSYLQYGFHQAEGIVVVAGNAGVGKSMMIEQLLVELEGADVVTATISPGPVSQDEVLAHILSGYQIEATGAGKVAQIDALREFLNDQRGDDRQVLLIVDEAQNLEKDALEEIRQLTNYTTAGESLIQVFLIGQPALMKVLGRRDMEQLAQRVIASCELQPMNEEETTNYVTHRMLVSGWSLQHPAFSDEAIEGIFQYTGGVPRKINTLCTRLLLQAALDEKECVDGILFESVSVDLDAEVIGRARAAGDEEGDPLPEANSQQNVEDLSPDAIESDNIVPLHKPVIALDAAVSAAQQFDVISEFPKREATTGGEVLVNAEGSDRSRSSTGASMETGENAAASSCQDSTDNPGSEPTSLEELAEQIVVDVNAELTSDRHVSGQISPEKLASLKAEMRRLAEGVQEDLKSVENNIGVLKGQLAEIEQQRTDRNSLIVYHLQRIDGVLKKMTDDF